MNSAPRADDPFVPHPLLRGAHRMTIAAGYWPRRFRRVGRRTVALRVRIDPEVEILALVDEPENPAAGTMILVHGLTGSAESAYMRGTAELALARGFRTYRVNLRGCGGTEHLAPTLYHSGLSGDVAAVIAEVEARHAGPIAVAGFSLGGNLVLKLAGEWGGASPTRVAAVAAVSAPIDLAACAARIGSGGFNRIYERYFVRRLLGQFSARAAAWPGRFEVPRQGIPRTLIEFDDAITAPHFGFAGAADYYARASALPLLPDIRVPTLAISAADDPWIEPTPYRIGSSRSRFLRVELPEHGGHLGFVAARRGKGDAGRFWAESRVVDFLSGAAFAAG